jgi:hypothetical protein
VFIRALLATCHLKPDKSHAQVFLEFKISGRTKALENPKWEKIIARDKRAGGIGEDMKARIVLGLYGKVPLSI